MVGNQPAMWLLKLGNLFVNLFVAGQVDWIDLVFVYEVDGLELEVLELCLVGRWLVEVEDAFFEGLGAELLDVDWPGEVLYGVVDEVVDDVL